MRSGSTQVFATGWRLRSGWLIGAALALSSLGFVIGLLTNVGYVRRGPVDGMCVALDMAMAHGFVDDVGRTMVEEAIASPTNPYFDRLPVTRSELRRTCSRIAAERWNW